MIDINIKYIYLFFLIIIFFLYGLILSEIIDYIFPEYDKKLDDYKIVIEIIGEIGIAYIIYFCLQRYSEIFIKLSYKRISETSPLYLNQLLLIAFSTGIFKHLQKSTFKIKYFKEKYINFDFNYYKKGILNFFGKSQ
jgi:hypothetical protein